MIRKECIGVGYRKAVAAQKRADNAVPGDTLARLIQADRALYGCVREFKFHEERRWRIDFAWPDERVAVEVEGGIWTGGRHTRGSGFLKDAEKYNELALAGWMLLRVSAADAKSGKCMPTIRRAFLSRVT